ncbi:MAG: helix-turn-helix domain-containing protein [Candidatus Methylomirabilales bacterium]
MQCECGRSMRKRQVTKAAPYAYTESGLDNVVLSGITVYVCPYCQAEVPVIPRIGQLHRVIADTLLHKPELLTGQELRFLRKHAGLPAQKFADLLEVRPEHLSRIENGHTKALGKPTDRLARALVLAASSREDVRGVLLRMAEELGRRRRMRKAKRPVFTLVKNQWRLAA